MRRLTALGPFNGTVCRALQRDGPFNGTLTGRDERRNLESQCARDRVYRRFREPPGRALFVAQLEPELAIARDYLLQNAGEFAKRGRRDVQALGLEVRLRLR
mgnify:CR=1 FL=1